MKVAFAFAGFVVVVAMLTVGPPIHPLVVRATVHDTVAKIVPLRVDTVRVLERAGMPSCMLPAVVLGVATAEHDGGDTRAPHGHYKVQSGYHALSVTAVPPNAKPGDVVCVLEAE